MSGTTTSSQSSNHLQPQTKSFESTVHGDADLISICVSAVYKKSQSAQYIMGLG
jgi:hypothetical protein